MTLTTVQSNAIHAIGYDRQRLILEVVFNSGGIYRYTHVPPQIVYRFLNSPSKGRFFQENIRGTYTSYRISRQRVNRRSSSKAKTTVKEVNPVTTDSASGLVFSSHDETPSPRVVG